ncbi:unnamed protein product [Diatraea saccharalis]|uniref:Uncharacterized protein n=1 Tax=Diatraea saccharalis TaxID=40085 RepID=A0A9N9R8V5_9NEOP|nr:unnamed protein product [Diatraea saccharalis]
MSENSDNDDDNNVNMSDSEVLKECEKEMQEIFEWKGLENQNTQRDLSKNKLVEKRTREESENSEEIIEDEFTTVTKRRSKRLNRNTSIVNSNNLTDTSTENKTEVCITSLQILPKQMALAKLLKNENIESITQIKYKSPYKVLIDFENRHEAEKLMKCTKINEMGGRCQIVSEMALSYGIVRGVDLELEDKDIIEIFESCYKIISVNRLNRLNTEGKWTKSETIRICFNNSTLPPYVYAYGCRFKVERYVFPVTQCSGCWRFGHILKFCPSKNIKCPKCGQNHKNCTTTDIKCLNCKGKHFVLDKSCPAFLKEKEIRKIMSEENITYRKGLQIFLRQNKGGNTESYINENMDCQSVVLPISSRPTYSSVVKSNKPIMNTKENNTFLESMEEENQSDSYSKEDQSGIKSTKTKKTTKEYQQEDYMCDTHETENHHNTSEYPNNIDRKNIFKILLIKIKEIVISNMTLERKLVLIFKLIFEEIKNYILTSFKCGDFIKPLFDILYGS